MSIGVDVIKSGQEIKARCPVHLKRTGKEDNNPSFYINAESGLWLCYSCGARGNLSHLISEMTGMNSEDPEIAIMIMNHGISQLETPKWEKIPAIDNTMYFHYTDVPKKYLKSRNISPDTAREYGIRWNEDNSSWIIPVISPEGALLGWQEKAQNFVRNHPKGIKMRHTLFGIEKLTSKTVILVESPLDVVRFSSSFDGMQCLASFGASITSEQLRLLFTVADKVIVALDNDKAGITSAKQIFKSMPLIKQGIHWIHYSHTDAKDIGEMTDQEIEVAINKSSVIPWWL
jgi:DNA primase